MPTAKKSKTSNADAAAILRMHEDEVVSVEDDLAVTFDGQVYQLTGDNPGDYVWLPTGKAAENAAKARTVTELDEPTE